MLYTNLNSNKSKDAVEVRWYWRTVALFASSLILGGFLVLPSTFDSQAQLRVSQTVVGSFGVILLVLGFVLNAIVCFGCGSLAFTADNVFLPAAISSLIGFLTVPYCFIVSTRFVWKTPSLITTIASALCAITYAGLYVFTRRRHAQSPTKANERIDLLHRPSISSITPSYHTPGYFANHVANMYPAATKAPPSIVTPEEDPTNEEELQRRHMSALLNTPEPYISPSTSPFNRIEFNVDETDPPPHGYYAPTASAAYTTQQLDESWRNRNASWVSADSRQASATREERRREIEHGRA